MVKSGPMGSCHRSPFDEIVPNKETRGLWFQPTSSCGSTNVPSHEGVAFEHALRVFSSTDGIPNVKSRKKAYRVGNAEPKASAISVSPLGNRFQGISLADQHCTGEWRGKTLG